MPEVIRQKAQGTSGCGSACRRAGSFQEMAKDTGFISQDAQSDFNRARRRQVGSRLSARLRRVPDDIDLILPYDEVVAAVGRTSEKRLGLQVIEVDSIVGTVDATRDFDRRFRPTSPRVRGRWEGVAKAMRRGDSMPPIKVRRIGDLHFVEDGRHRVSVAREIGLENLDAYVTQVMTAVSPGTIEVADLAIKSHERLFYERVPLPHAARTGISMPQPIRYAALAEGVEAWGFRLMQATGEHLTRAQVAEAWWEDEYLPVVEMLREADLVGDRSDAEAYVAVVTLRYMLLRTHDWNEEVVEQLREELSRLR